MKLRNHPDPIAGTFGHPPQFAAEDSEPTFNENRDCREGILARPTKLAIRSPKGSLRQV
jgi:hypothetical protein